MNRGDLYRIYKPSKQHPKLYRTFVIVSRGILLTSKFSTCVCAPIYSRYDELSAQVPVGIEEGLKHASSIHCDELVSILKPKLTHFVGSLSPMKLQALNQALKIALDLE